MISEERRKNQETLYWLTQLRELGAVAMERMYAYVGSYEGIYHIEGTEWIQNHVLSERQGAQFDAAKGEFCRWAEAYHRLADSGIRFVTVLDDEYPKRLTHIYGHPKGIYVKGQIPADDLPTAAIVVNRSFSAYGMQMARMLGASLGRNGIQIVSGMALGVDGEGHAGALSEDGATFAVLGCGVDVCYPRRHRDLYERIPQRGGILSEFCLGEPPLARNFPMRNRIISGLSDVVIVVEARQRSGSLITAELALEQGKEVFAVPGMVTEERSRGCNALIQQGAGIVTSPYDILDYFQIKNQKKLNLHEKKENPLAKREKIVYSCLDSQAKHLDQIAQQCGLSVNECMTVLLELELKGFVLQPAGHFYVRAIT